MDCDNEKIPRTIDAMFVKGITQRRWRLVREHLYACVSCRHYYNRVLSLQRTLNRNTAPLLPEQVMFIGEEVIRRSTKVKGRYGWPALGVSVMVALTAMVLMLVGGTKPELVGDTKPELVGDTKPEIYVPNVYQARGVSGNAGAGVRAFCITSMSTIRAAYPVENVETGIQACTLNDVLQFTYSNNASGKGFDYLFLFGIDKRMSPLWYYPHPQEGQSITLSSYRDAVNIPLPGEVRLAVNHEAGPVRVIGLFSNTPVSVQSVEEYFSQLRKQPPPIDLDVGPLDLVPHTRQIDFLMHIEER